MRRTNWIRLCATCGREYVRGEWLDPLPHGYDVGTRISYSVCPSCDLLLEPMPSIDWPVTVNEVSL